MVKDVVSLRSAGNLHDKAPHPLFMSKGGEEGREGVWGEGGVQMLTEGLTLIIFMLRSRQGCYTGGREEKNA